ncbi:GcrA family cell cycle regulator [Asaia krungthepensis]|uniref:GcrA cell cycle regulator n=1 Tax=Asaia krungthepensis NRIC 0535 TaxID=1307925 RepID=A0ABQ0Q3J7_9PROT|nr:GcrA family cell cycle regulator [Asaia krungthepensis]GBQ89711.1 hypothetical protein AA0535_1865 [Asaia krungthepensis NRIC 0535]
MEWTDEIISRLQTLWQEGLSTAEIGRQLSITKNAVVGKAHRLGLPPRPSPIRASAKPRKDAAAEAAPVVTSAPAESAQPVDAVSVKSPETKASISEDASVTVAPLSSAEIVRPATQPVPPAASRAEPAVRTAPAQPAPAQASSVVMEDEAQDAPKASSTRKPAEAKTMAPDLMLRPLLRPLTADTSPRRGPACCWPNGDPGTPGFHFCGAKPVPGKPYCAEHCAIAYVKLRDRRESVG